VRAWLSVALTLSLFLAASSARAQLLMQREHDRQMDSGRIGLGVDLNTFFGYRYSLRHDAGYSFIAPTALASFRFRELVIEAAMPFAYVHENNDPGADNDLVALGNPWFSLAYLPDCECGLSRLSLGIAAPVARGDDPFSRELYALARGANGDWDGYLWLPDALPLVLGASARKDIRFVRIAWDGDLIVSLPGRGRETEFGAQTAGELDFLFGWKSTLGFRISGVTYPTLPGDKFQSALTTYFRYSTVNGSFALRFVLNFDPPHGFSFSDDGVWGAALSYSRSLL
jgi:hypothetical protein